MKYLLGEKEKIAWGYINEAVKIAKKSTCQRSKCGAVIVKDGEIIGEGFNSPPKDKEDQRRCNIEKDSYHKKVKDKTCCIHAEQRAVFLALKNHPQKILGSQMYFIRLDLEDNIIKAGQPFCTICSKMALDIGIVQFILLHEKGICAYNTDEYNNLSYQFRG